MGLLSEIAAAVETYPREYLEIEIFEVDWPGTVIDVNEDVTFRVRVSNSGPLDVDELEVLIEGLNGAQVKNANAHAQWTDSFVLTGVIPPVPAHSATDPGPVEMTSGDLHFRATRPARNAKDLVRVSVAGWASDFGHIFGGHTRADAEAKDAYSATVSAA